MEIGEYWSVSNGSRSFGQYQIEIGEYWSLSNGNW